MQTRSKIIVFPLEEQIERTGIEMEEQKELLKIIFRDVSQEEFWFHIRKFDRLSKKHFELLHTKILKALQHS